MTGVYMIKHKTVILEESFNVTKSPIENTVRH